MQNHTISLNLTSAEVASLQAALKDSLSSVIGALESSMFDYERPELESQADVLDVLIEAIENVVTGDTHA